MCLVILFAAVVVPVAEIVVASAVAEQVGWGSTLAALLGLMLVGMLILRGPQRWAWRRAAEPRSSDPPVAELSARAILLGMAGGLLVFPGFLTAAAGLVLALPPVTRMAARGMVRRFEEQVAAAGTAPPGAAGYWRMTTVRRVRTQGPTVVEGSVVRSEEATPSSGAGSAAGGPGSPGTHRPPGAIAGPPPGEARVVDGEVVEDKTASEAAGGETSPGAGSGGAAEQDSGEEPRSGDAGATPSG